MNRRFQFSVVAISTCVVSLLLFGAVYGHSASTDNPYGNLGVYSEVLAKIKLDYVEEPDMKAVTLGAINGMLESIGYSTYHWSTGDSTQIIFADTTRNLPCNRYRKIVVLAALWLM